MSRICLVSHPRSGSTSLLRTLAKKAEVSSAYEMFHMNEEVVLEHLKHALSDENIEIIKEKSSELGFDSLKEFYQNDSLKYLDLVHSLAESNDFIFKIFPYHIKSEENLKKIINSCDFVIFLSRNSLHSCISNQVAQQVGTYANVDTSAVTVDFDEEEFISWHNNIINFIENVENKVDEANGESLKYTYEDIFCSNSIDQKVESLIAKLRFELRSDGSKVPLLRKQDSRGKASEKVSNPDFLKSFLDALNLSDLDDLSTCTPPYRLFNKKK